MRKSLVVSIQSGKGGVGKSLVAANAAAMIAGRQARTLLIDADINFGNQHILMNVAPTHSIIDCVVSSQVLADTVVRINPFFDLLAAPLQPHTIDEEIRTGLSLDSLLVTARQTYDVVIIDHASGIDRLGQQAVKKADRIAVVTLPELPAIADAVGLCKYLTTAGAQANIDLVVNRVDETDDAPVLGESFRQICRQLGLREPQSITDLPNDSAARQALARQAGLADVAPEAALTVSLRRWAHSLLTPQGPAPGSTATFRSINELMTIAEEKE